ncbi:MAG: aspartate-semialdehyde dehydrogenase [Candidatus Auribacterota bacterium]|nr:aspartate-semialdehyde dehydrogenase [Candidatus Auribacterota bacterium]
MKAYNIAIAGVTGAVGQEMLSILEERDFPVQSIKGLASERSAGKEFKFKDEKFVIELLSKNSFKGIDIAFFSAGGSLSKKFVPFAVESGAVVVDNTSAYRMDPDVPLVIPEINSESIADYKKKGIIANPNCTTAVALMGIAPIHRYSRVKRIVASSYQSVSGAGAKAINELEEQINSWVSKKPLKNNVFPYQIAFNVIPHIDSFGENGFTKEEMKLHNESRKILGDKNLSAVCTTVRVPVFRAHSVSVNIETEKKVTVKKARELIEAFPGVQLYDDISKNIYPMPLYWSGKDDCSVGRLREDYSVENGLSFFVVGDQIRKGAALNAVQIAEELVAVLK